MESVEGIRAGHVLGRYELLVPVASGGMASVWAARVRGARGFQKIVAVKVMLAELAEDTNFEAMFLDEASNASRIRHPNVAEILDLGEQAGVLYQVLEWVDGEPLHVVLREAKTQLGLPIPLAIRIGVQACAGLHAAHELRDDTGAPLRLVHRDVSPQNILVGYDGVVKLVDFGVAKAATNKAETVIGQMKGKAPYMAPEQALSMPLDRRADIFALGIVLYQLTTGKHPYRGDNDLQTLRRICDNTPAVPPGLIVPSYPVDLDKVVAKAVAKSAADRFATMEEMLFALENAVPPEKRASDADVAAFMNTVMGDRGRARRESIRSAVRKADATSGEVPVSRAQTEPRPMPAMAAASSARPASSAPSRRPRATKRPPKKVGLATRAKRVLEREQARAASSLLVFVLLVGVLGAVTGWYLHKMEEGTRTHDVPPPAPTAASSAGK